MTATDGKVSYTKTQNDVSSVSQAKSTNDGLSITDHMVLRSQAWHTVVRTLEAYFTEYRATITEFSQLEQRRASKLAQFTAPDHLLGVGQHGVVDVVERMHQLYKKESEIQAKEIKTLDENVLPKLKNLIMGLNKSISDFKQLSQSMGSIKQVDAKRKEFETEAKKYAEAIEALKAGQSPSADSYILKSTTEYHRLAYEALIKKVAEDRRFAKDAVINVDKSVVEELQVIIKEFAIGLSERAQNLHQTSNDLIQGFVANSCFHEFDEWQKENPGAFEELQVHDIAYPYQNSTLAKVVLRGHLQRRTKYLRSFVSGEFILTLFSLIEMKNGVPNLGIDLTDAKVINDSKHATDDRLVLYARQIGTTSGRFHTWVFRTTEVESWKQALEMVITHKTPKERALAAFGSLTESPERVDPHTQEKVSKEDASTRSVVEQSITSPTEKSLLDYPVESHDKSIIPGSVPDSKIAARQTPTDQKDDRGDSELRHPKEEVSGHEGHTDIEDNQKSSLDGIDKSSAASVFEESLESSGTQKTGSSESVCEIRVQDHEQIGTGGGSVLHQVNKGNVRARTKSLPVAVDSTYVSCGPNSATTSDGHHDYDADSDVSEVAENHIYRPLIAPFVGASSNSPSFWETENSCEKPPLPGSMAWSAEKDLNAF